MACPQPPQKRFPAITSLPQRVQYLFAISPYRSSAFAAERCARIERLAALIAMARRGGMDRRLLNPDWRGRRKRLWLRRTRHNDRYRRWTGFHRGFAQFPRVQGYLYQHYAQFSQRIEDNDAEKCDQ
jgi:hypothetical protein